MLGHGKIKYETPNAIDAGDQPLSRPARIDSVGPGAPRSRPSDSSQSTRSSTSSSSSASAPSNKRSQRIPLEYKMDFHEEPPEITPSNSDEELDMEHGAKRTPNTSATSSPRYSPDPDSPTMDQARNLAVQLLWETEKRSRRSLYSDDSHLAGSVRRMYDGISRGDESERFRRFREALELNEEGPIKETCQGPWRKWRELLMIVILITLVVLFGFGVSKAVQSQKNKSPAVPESIRLETTKKVLIDSGISTRKALNDPKSPQSEAATWIANVDNEMLEIPSLAVLKDNSDASTPFVQRYVLAVLYFSTNGPRWTSSMNFLGIHECSWFDTVPDQSGENYAMGVTCDDNLQVRNLLIPSNNLEGSIPEEIRYLSNLDFLDFKQNSITGSIPSGVQDLTMLDYFDLKHNDVTGTIPAFFGDLDRLQVLGLSGNQLSGSLPESLGKLVTLKTLSVDDNMLTGSLSPVSTMTNLMFLYAEHNKFDGKLKAQLFKDLENLAEADLGDNELETDREIPSEIFALPRLRMLDLSENNISGKFPSDLPSNDVMEFLSVRLNKIPSTIPESVSNLQVLQHLDLEENLMTGTIPESIGDLDRLTYLALGKNSLGDPTTPVVPDFLQFLTNLQELSMDSMNLSGGVPAWIHKFTGLKLLDLRNNKLSGPIDIDFTQLPELEVLMLNDNELTGAVPESLASLTNLSVLSLHHNGLEGTTGEICRASDQQEQLITFDCETVACDCCEEQQQECCDGDDCFSEIRWDALEMSEQEGHFHRSNSSFNPHILFREQL